MKGIMDKVVGLAVAAIVMVMDTDPDTGTGSTVTVMDTDRGSRAMVMVIQIGNMVAIITVSRGSIMSTNSTGGRQGKVSWTSRRLGKFGRRKRLLDDG